MICIFYDYDSVPVSYTNEGIISFGTTAGTTTEEEMPLLDGDEEVEGKPFVRKFICVIFQFR